MNENPSDLQYYLLSARNPLPDQTELHDKAFKFWLSVWKPTMAELNYSDSHLHEDFIRQDLVGCICHKGEVISVLLFSFFGLGPQAIMEFRYMKENYNDLYFQKIKRLGVQTVMSMQYLAVHPQWRGRKNPTAPPMTALMTILALKVRDLYEIDAGIAPIRRDFDTTATTYALGGDCIMEKVISHNIECDLVASIRGRTHDHPDQSLQNLVDYLWDHRIDSAKSKPTQRLKVA